MLNVARRHDESPPHRSCWTCKVRRKKCDGHIPICDTCAGLGISCYHDEVKPEWMDGAARQEAMAEALKCEVKDNAHRRRSQAVTARSNHTVGNATSAAQWTVLVQRQPTSNPEPPNHENDTGSPDREDVDRPSLLPSSAPRKDGCLAAGKRNNNHLLFDRSETFLIMFYCENLIPVLYPFYAPPLLQGGKAWILDMMISSPVVRQATLCQSSYYLALAQGVSSNDQAWEMVLAQTRYAFDMLRRALQHTDGPGIGEHMHGAVRIMTSIIQLQRFEAAIMSYNNHQVHLTAAVALFQQLLDICATDATHLACPSSRFDAVVSRLGPVIDLRLGHKIHIPSPEQSAFHFSSALLLLDDIIASTILQGRPKLYEYHNSLLGNFGGCKPKVDLGVAVGCQNWPIIQIGEIAALDAWKQQCKRSGNLDVMQLVGRATSIKESLVHGLVALADTTRTTSPTLSNVFEANHFQQAPAFTGVSSLATRIWAHAAILYLHLVVSGYQPASADVRHHVRNIIELMRHPTLSPVLLRTMSWPYCVAGCLAEPLQEPCFRSIAELLQPSSVFGTFHKALEIMESVWTRRKVVSCSDYDLAACFRNHGDIVLLV